MYPTIHYHLQVTWIHSKNIVLLYTSWAPRKPLNAKIFLNTYGQTFLFSVYPIHWLYHVKGKVFHKKKWSSSGYNNNSETLPILWYTLTIVSHVSPRYFLSLVKGVVNMAHFQLMHVGLGSLFKDMIMYNVDHTIVPWQILYKESNNCRFVFVLASVSCCLLPAAIVV